MYQNIATKVLTGEVRLSYVNLVTPRSQNPQNPADKPKYSCQILIPKTDTATVQDILNSIEAAAQKAVNEKWGGVRPQFASVLHDGDGVKPDAGTPYGAECKGHWVLNASSDLKPNVVDISNINVDLAPQDIYSGMYARVTLNFYGFKNKKVGVGCGLGNVMKTRDGEPLGGGASAASDFAGIGQSVAAVPGATQPTVPYTAPSVPGQTYTGAINPITGLPM